MSELEWPQGWYLSQCDGDWEHEFGVTIETLDNPGWSLRVDLAATELDGLGFQSVQYEASEHVWWSCKVEERQFVAYCGPQNLLDVIRVFREWRSNSGDTSAP